MAKFVRSIATNGKIKACMISENNQFVDSETGEVLDLAGMLRNVYGDQSFDISTTQKADNDIEPQNE